MSDIGRVLFASAVSVATCVIALPLGYIWTRAMHYPFTPRQRKMWTLYALIIPAAAVVCPVFVAMVRLWKLPLNQSAAIALVLLAAWMVIAFFIVHRMSRLQGNKERGSQTSEN